MYNLEDFRSKNRNFGHYITDFGLYLKLLGPDLKEFNRNPLDFGLNLANKRIFI